MTSGVSIVVCCHNSAKRLPETMAHLRVQQVEGVDWDVLVVDNASTDTTAQVAAEAWSQDAPATLRIVQEPRPGLSFARERALAEAKHDIISFVDDDNWVNPRWVQSVADVMSQDRRIAACGGCATAVFETPPPKWFEKAKQFYAVGSQAPSNGDITWTRGYLWGAGLSVRKSALEAIYRNGYAPQMLGEHGTSLRPNEDIELCYVLRLAGFKLWYDERLSLQHYMPTSRLKWEYCRRMARANGRARVVVDIYKYAALETRQGKQEVEAHGWVWQSSKTASTIAKNPKLWRALVAPSEGDPNVLKLDAKRGRLEELLRMRGHYDKAVQRIQTASWRQAAVRTELQI